VYNVWTRNNPTEYRKKCSTDHTLLIDPTVCISTQTVSDVTAISLYLRFNGHFPGESGSVGLPNLRMTEVVVTTGARRRAKLQSNHHHQQTNTQCFTGRMPFLSPNQQCQSTEGKSITLHELKLLTPSSPGVFQPCLWPWKAPGYLGESYRASHRPSDASTQQCIRPETVVANNDQQLPCQIWSF